MNIFLNVIYSCDEKTLDCHLISQKNFAGFFDEYKVIKKKNDFLVTLHLKGCA